MTPQQQLWIFLPLGYLLTIAIETPILMLGLSPQHSWKRRLFAGFWLTACTYPIVVLVLPLLLDAQEERTVYLLVAETFAPVAECALFWAAFGTREQWGKWSMLRDFLVITLANLASFGAGELLKSEHYWPPEFLLPEAAQEAGQERTFPLSLDRTRFPRHTIPPSPDDPPARKDARHEHDHCLPISSLSHRSFLPLAACGSAHSPGARRRRTHSRGMPC